MHHRNTFFVLPFALAACATAGGPAELATPTPPTAAELPALEARLQQEPANVPLRVLVAAGHRDGGRPETTVSLLEPVAAGAQGDAAAVFLLGLAYEDLERYAQARQLYTAMSERGGPLAGRARERVALVERLELEAAVRGAIADEQRLAATTPTPRTVGVFPFLFAGDDEDLSPLSRAMAELLTTDLAQTDRLTVLERAQVQHLIDELALAQSGYVDTLTAARTGRLLGASRIVQGRIGGAEAALDLTAAVVAVGPLGSEGGVSPLEQGGPLQQLFDMEKALALDIYSTIGLQLTAAERARVEQRHTSNVQALIAFGYGLEAEDAGNIGQAVLRYQEAVQLDANFGLARERLDESRLLATVMPMPPQEATRIGVAALPPQPVPTTGVTPQTIVPLDRIEAVERMIPDPLVRNPAAEAFGVEGLGRRPIIQIIIRPPGSGE